MSDISVSPLDEEHDRWLFRRRAVFASATFLAAVWLGLLVLGDPNNAIQKAASDNAVWGFFLVIGCYIGAPIADDWLQKKASHGV
jgi:hypothetical protein